MFTRLCGNGRTRTCIYGFSVRCIDHLCYISNLIFGRSTWNRTRDLRLKRALLCQLSYEPKKYERVKSEKRTRRSNQLSYKAIFKSGCFDRTRTCDHPSRIEVSLFYDTIQFCMREKTQSVLTELLF
jgi:hypothetical protein